MPAPDKINLEEKKTDQFDGKAYIMGHIDGVPHMFTRIEAISLINELTGVLLADEYRRGHSQSIGGDKTDIRRKIC